MSRCAAVYVCMFHEGDDMMIQQLVQPYNSAASELFLWWRILWCLHAHRWRWERGAAAVYVQFSAGVFVTCLTHLKAQPPSAKPCSPPNMLIIQSGCLSAGIHPDLWSGSFSFFASLLHLNRFRPCWWFCPVSPKLVPVGADLLNKGLHLV